MKMHPHLSPDAIILDLAAGDKAGAIAEVSERLRHHPAMGDFEQFVGAVLSREAESSTGIGNGIAIPHARTDRVRDFVVAVGRSAEGVPFEAIDDRPVNLVIMMGIPTAQVKSYLQLLGHLSLLLKQRAFVDALLSAPDPAAVIKVFEDHEE